jgi:hypothetical protein
MQMAELQDTLQQMQRMMRRTSTGKGMTPDTSKGKGGGQDMMQMMRMMMGQGDGGQDMMQMMRQMMMMQMMRQMMGQGRQTSKGG